MVAETKQVDVPTKKVVEAQDPQKVTVRQAWHKIHFLSKKETGKRFGVVTIMLVVLTLLIALLDFGLISGFQVLADLDFSVPWLKTTLSVLFCICAIALIVVEGFRKSKTKGFSVSSNQGKVRTGNDFLGLIVMWLGIATGVLALAIYLLD